MTSMFDGDSIVIVATDVVVVFMFEDLLCVIETVLRIIFVSE